MKDDLHCALAPGRSAKQQALEVLKKLQAIGVPIVRARMHLKVHLRTAVIGESIIILVRLPWQCFVA